MSRIISFNYSATILHWNLIIANVICQPLNRLRILACFEPATTHLWYLASNDENKQIHICAQSP